MHFVLQKHGIYHLEFQWFLCRLPRFSGIWKYMDSCFINRWGPFPFYYKTHDEDKCCRLHLIAVWSYSINIKRYSMQMKNEKTLIVLKTHTQTHTKDLWVSKLCRSGQINNMVHLKKREYTSAQQHKEFRRQLAVHSKLSSLINKTSRNTLEKVGVFYFFLNQSLQ